MSKNPWKNYGKNYDWKIQKFENPHLRAQKVKKYLLDCKRLNYTSYFNQVDSSVSCDILANWSAFSYALFPGVNHIFNCSFQYGRINLAYLLPYRSSMAKELKSRRALDPKPFNSPGARFNVHAGKNG